jgi:hypothetical protein
MTVARKRRRDDGTDEEQTGKGGVQQDATPTTSGTAETAAAASHSAAAASTTAAAADSASFRTGITVSDDVDSDTGSSSDEDEEQTEYVVVRMPASLVHRMRAEQDNAADAIADAAAAALSDSKSAVAAPPPSSASVPTVVLEGLDTARPYFDASYTQPQHGRVTHRFVGTYEYSVGTQLLWRIHDGQTTTRDSIQHARAQYPCRRSGLLTFLLPVCLRHRTPALREHRFPVAD